MGAFTVCIINSCHIYFHLMMLLQRSILPPVLQILWRRRGPSTTLGNVYCEVPSFQFALFVMFSSYYVLHLEYPKVVQSVLYILQDYILAYPDSCGRPFVYLGTASDIKKLSILHNTLFRLLQSFCHL